MISGSQKLTQILLENRTSEAAGQGCGSPAITGGRPGSGGNILEMVLDSKLLRHFPLITMVILSEAENLVVSKG
jgi:hypothetical protein